MRDVGCSEMFTGTRRTPERDRVAARVRREDALSHEAYCQFADTLNRVGEITLKNGVRTCFHSHVGSHIETREEIDRLMSLVDPALVFQGVDIGHLAWSGADPVQFCRDYANQIKAVHIKDINPKILQQGISEGWDYQTFSDRGIFAEICEGFVDFPSVFEVLRETNYQGWIVVEIDVTTKPSALDSVTISRRNLRSMGL
jgi:inosose dehydratase